MGEVFAEHTVFHSVVSALILDKNLLSALTGRGESRFMRIPLSEKHEHCTKLFINPEINVNIVQVKGTTGFILVGQSG